MLLDLGLHRKQFDLFKDPARFQLCCSGRRFGKTRYQIAKIITTFLETKLTERSLSEPVIVVAAPTLISAKRVLWRPLCNFLKDIPSLKINKSDLTIELPGHPMIRLASMEAGEGIRGLRILLFSGDEAQDYRPNLLDEVVLPAMADTAGSQMRLTFTPKGKTNWLYKVKDRDGWNCFNYTTADNPFIPKIEIENAKKSLPAKTFEQEFMASWVSFSGQLFPDYSSLNLRSTFPECKTYYMGLDWGDINPAIVVIGENNGHYYIVHWDTLGDGSRVVNNEELFRTIKEVAIKFNPAITFCDPSRPSSIFEVRQLGKIHNLIGLKKAIGAENSISSGINVVNTLFFQLRLFAPDKAEEEIQSYRHKLIRLTGQYVDIPEDGQKDHTIDAMRYILYSLYRQSKCKLILDH